MVEEVCGRNLRVRNLFEIESESILQSRLGFRPLKGLWIESRAGQMVETKSRVLVSSQ